MTEKDRIRTASLLMKGLNVDELAELTGLLIVERNEYSDKRIDKAIDKINSDSDSNRMDIAKFHTEWNEGKPNTKREYLIAYNASWDGMQKVIEILKQLKSEKE